MTWGWPSCGCAHAHAGVSPGVRRFVVRTSLALGALLTARFVPFLGLVMALIGPTAPWLYEVHYALPLSCPPLMLRAEQARHCCFVECRLFVDDRREHRVPGGLPSQAARGAHSCQSFGDGGCASLQVAAECSSRALLTGRAEHLPEGARLGDDPRRNRLRAVRNVSVPGVPQRRHVICIVQRRIHTSFKFRKFMTLRRLAGPWYNGHACGECASRDEDFEYHA